MYFDDLLLYEYYLPYKFEEVKNIGWLDGEHEFTKGIVNKDFIAKFENIILSDSPFNAEVNRIRGIHPCNLCGTADVQVSKEGKSIPLGMSEIWIPDQSGENYYASPSMILHYSKEHNYCPPEEFVNAVLSVDLNSEFNAQSVYEDLISKYNNN